MRLELINTTWKAASLPINLLSRLQIEIPMLYGVSGKQNSFKDGFCRVSARIKYVKFYIILNNISSSTVTLD